MQILQAYPAENAPDIFAIEESETDTSLVVRGLTADGRQMWMLPLPGSVTLPNGDPTLYYWDAVPDTLGGVVILYEDDQYYFRLVRVDGVTGQETWQYPSGAFLVDDFAMTPSGVMYVIQRSAYPFSSGVGASLLGINLATGVIQQNLPLPDSGGGCNFPAADTGSVWPEVGAPMVAPDGSIYLEVHIATFPGGAFDDKMSLLQVTPAGSVVWTTLAEFISSPSGDPPAITDVGDVIPDGQGGVLAAWTEADNPYTDVIYKAHVTDVNSSGSNDLVLPFGPWGVYTHAWFDPTTAPPDQSLVLGENGVAFAKGPATYGTSVDSVVSFNIADGSVNWTWQPPVGMQSVEMVAATEGNGMVVKGLVCCDPTNQYVPQIVQLDSTGTPVTNGSASASTASDPPTITSLQYDVGDQWLATISTGDPTVETAAVSLSAVVWAKSSFPTQDQGEMREAYHHYVFDLFFCTVSVCSPYHQDVPFTYYQDNPEYEPTPSITLTQSQQTAVRALAFKAVKAAFAGYPVKFDVTYYSTPPKDTAAVWVVGDSPELIIDPITGQSSVPCGLTNVAGILQTSWDYYLENVGEAQYALNLQISAGTAEADPSFPSLINAIGEGLGNTAAHEIGWQLNLKGMDDSSVGTYNGFSCDGSKDPAEYTGQSTDGTPIHWEDVSAQSLRSVIYAK